MIKCHLSRLMGERKLKISDVARETGLHRNSITLLYDETAVRVDLEAIDKHDIVFGVGAKRRVVAQMRKERKLRLFRKRGGFRKNGRDIACLRNRHQAAFLSGKR